jgi:hypothetical protein
VVNERRVDTGDPSPHFDGAREGPIADPAGGPTMGVRSDIDPENPTNKNPYDLKDTRNEDMELLNEIIGGKKVKEEE